jgi:quaternary ammonium compound-resistance protein SugE
MAWLILIVAGFFEIGWAVAMKYSEGFTKLTPSVIMILSMAVSIYLLSVALKEIPLGTGYAVWTGIGAAGTAVLGIVLFKEPLSIARLICIFLIISGIVGLRIFSK